MNVQPVQPEPVQLPPNNKIYIETGTGWLKLSAIILGIISVGVGSVAHFRQSIVLFIEREESALKVKSGKCTFLEPERFFLAVTILSLILSIFSLIINSFTTVTSKRPDARFHKLAGCLLSVAGGAFVFSALNLDKRCGYRDKMSSKISAGVITIINSVLYLTLGCWTLRTKPQPQVELETVSNHSQTIDSNSNDRLKPPSRQKIGSPRNTSSKQQNTEDSSRQSKPFLQEGSAKTDRK